MPAPNSIILNTRDQVKKLRLLSKDIEIIEGRYFVVDILEDVMHCLRNCYTAKQDLQSFINEIKSGHYEYGYTLLGKELADCVEELGFALFEQLKTLGVYFPGGQLPYHYCTVADPNFHDVLLTQTHELT